MSGQTLLIILLVGLIAGWLAGQIVQGTGFGIIADIAIGIVGAAYRQLAPPSLGHPSWLRDCPGYYRRHHWCARYPSHPQIGLSKGPMVIEPSGLSLRMI